MKRIAVKLVGTSTQLDKRKRGATSDTKAMHCMRPESPRREKPLRIPPGETIREINELQRMRNQNWRRALLHRS